MNIRTHYDTLLAEGNDPVLDPPPLRDYMDKWDGAIFLAELTLDRTKSVLEIGVGTGRLAVKTAPLCRHFTGIDIAPRTLERAGAHLAAWHPTLLCGDFLTYDFSATYDVVYSSLTFLHIADKLAAVKKIAQLLTSGGRFVLSTDKNPVDTLDAGHGVLTIYPDTPEEITRCITAAGLTLTAHHETEFAHIFTAIK